MILLTGASGFVGQALLKQLLDENHHVTIATRHNLTIPHCQPSRQVIAEIKPDTDWYDALQEVQLVIHTAGRVHVMRETVEDSLQAFREVNTLGTLNLARQAATSGVKRFIFISSIKVNGEITFDHKAFTSEDACIPLDPYGVSKYEAEQGLLKIAQETGMEVVIIRPPLIYGPNVKANFRTMMKWVNKGVPLPFGAIHNRRSLIALDNLVSFIIHCIEHPKAANEIFLVSDGEDVSTTELLQKVATAFGQKKARLIHIPVFFMSLLAKLVGKDDVANRLFGSLQVDSSKAYDLLGWKPVTTMDEQLKKIADTYLENEKTV